jgi:predicted amidophosphoribosyltransferase
MPLFLKRLFQFFLPSQCHCCEAFLEEQEDGICSNCFSRIRWIEPPFCSICGTPFTSKAAKSHPCGSCMTKKKYFTMARALGYYEGSLQEAIHQWKYAGKVSLNRIFGEWMVEGLRRYWNPDSFDLLIPVPLHRERLRDRGFNQALLLAKELSHRTGIPYRRRILQRKKGERIFPSGRKGGGAREIGPSGG